jgi:hypothetical protein
MAQGANPMKKFYSHSFVSYIVSILCTIFRITIKRVTKFTPMGFYLLGLYSQHFISFITYEWAQ